MIARQSNSAQLMARIYQIALLAMVVVLMAALIIAMLGSDEQSQILSLLIEGFALAIPSALLVFTAVSLVRKKFTLGSIALLVTLIWGVFKIVG